MLGGGIMRKRRSGLILIITIIGSMIAGGFIGDLLKDYISIFSYNYPISIFNSQGNQWNIINLNVVKLSFGMLININLGSILGLFLGLGIFYKKW